MNSALTRILLPVTTDAGFESAASIALSLAKQHRAEIILAAIDDNRTPYETVPLPFHEKEFMHRVTPSEQILNSPIADRCASFIMNASKQDVAVREVLAQGHAATQALLLSRFSDLIILSASPHFLTRNADAQRKFNTIIEILDQTVVPILTPGTAPLTQITSVALFFDGGPYATRALHWLAGIINTEPDLPVFIRVSKIDPEIARRMGEECETFLRSKGLRDISIEYAETTPLEAIETEIFTPVDLVAMGIRSRHSYHDLHVGELAKHFLETQRLEATLFC